MAHILLLEDDLVLAKQLEEILQVEDHSAATFAAVDEALAYFNENKVDLVIADLFIKQGNQFSKEGGVTLMSGIRQVSGSTVPIIAISGSFTPVGTDSDHALVMKGTSATVGASATLAKPFQPQELLDLVAKMLDPAKRGPFPSL